MSIFGGIILFVSGVAIGGSAVAYNYHSIRRATTGLHKENERLKTCAWEDKMDYVYKQAYDEGYFQGRKSPLSDVERFADTLESRHIDFRTTRGSARPAAKGGTTCGQTPKR